jgi:hypothetical protein
MSMGQLATKELSFINLHDPVPFPFCIWVIILCKTMQDLRVARLIRSSLVPRPSDGGRPGDEAL